MDNNKLHICQNCIRELADEPYTSPFQYRGLFTNFKVPEDNICPKCKNNLYKTQVTMEEIKILFSISHDNKFLMSMIDLKEKNIIEFQLKMSQFKTQLEQQKSSKAQNDTTPRCPHCHSTNIKPISALNRGASIAMWGIFSKKINKSFECLNCKYTW